MIKTAVTIMALALSSGPLLAAGKSKEAKEVEFSFEGPFGKFDKAQLQRGFQVYNEVCSSCHSMELMYYRNLGEPGGPGFSEEERQHLFDPFYSGREAGRGLGFGLSKCWRIVRNHGGRIDVQSDPGRGATFEITLPVA